MPGCRSSIVKDYIKKDEKTLNALTELVKEKISSLEEPARKRAWSEPTGSPDSFVNVSKRKVFHTLSGAVAILGVIRLIARGPHFICWRSALPP